MFRERKHRKLITYSFVRIGNIELGIDASYGLAYILTNL